MAFLLVFTIHSTLYLFSGAWMPSFVMNFFSYGWAGVDLFFLISSFLMTEIFLREIQINGKIGIRKFYIRRAFRIWPLYYLILFLLFILGYATSIFNGRPLNSLSLTFFAPSLVFLGNYSLPLIKPELPSLGFLWSICVEEQFYLLFPIIFLFMIRARFLVWIFLVMVITVFSFVLKVFLLEKGVSYLYVVCNFFLRSENFLWGMTLSLLLRRSPKMLFKFSKIYSMFFLCLLGTIFFLYPQTGVNNPVGFNLKFLVNIAFFSVLLNHTVRWPFGFLARAFSFSPVVKLGRLTYGAYMYHFICLWVVSSTLFYFTGDRSITFEGVGNVYLTALFYCTGLIITFFAANFSYVHFESYFLKKKHAYQVIVTDDNYTQVKELQAVKFEPDSLKFHDSYKII